MIWLADRVSTFLQRNKMYEVLGLFIQFLDAHLGRRIPRAFEASGTRGHAHDQNHVLLRPLCSRADRRRLDTLSEEALGAEGAAGYSRGVMQPRRVPSTCDVAFAAHPQNGYEVSL